MAQDPTPPKKEAIKELKEAAPPPPPGEHIFPATSITKKAIRWKELNAKGRTQEAMELLEEIIIDSTPMFERLAQHENFHYTVDLPSLISAAQEKVMKWLLAWQPKKGKIFSWMSCAKKTPILLADGTYKDVDEIVENKLKVDVLCFDPHSGKFHARPIVGWLKAPSHRKEWRKLMINMETGYRRPIYLTYDHPVYTQRGLTAIDDLNPTDVLYIDTPKITEAGKQAIIGNYLGDGSVGYDGWYSISHGKDQLEYNQWFSEKFQGKLNVIEEGTVYWNSRFKRAMDHSGGNRTSIPLYKYWDDVIPQFWTPGGSKAHKTPYHKSVKKKITQWILDQITPLSLAVWYMDDGSYSSSTSSNLTLATQGFTQEETRMLIKKLNEFGIDGTFYLAPLNQPCGQKNQGSIYIPAKSHPRFFDLVAPYMLPYFDYKLPESYRKVQKIELRFIEETITSVPHKSFSNQLSQKLSWEVKKRFKLSRQAKCMPTNEDLKWKYDIEVSGYNNFFGGFCKLLVHNSKCSKNAFRSEVVKMSQYRKRYHVTGDSLEKFYGFDDHEINKHDATAALHNRLKDLTCRWGDPQEIGAIRYLVECIVTDDEHDKVGAITGAAFSYGISLELAKFFYTWVLVNLRDHLYEKNYVRFTEQDVLRHASSYTYLPDLIDTVGWEAFRKCIAVFGGMRIKFPTLAELAKEKEDYEIFREIDTGDKDPDAVANVARKRKKTPRTAQEVFLEMSEKLNQNRAGEYGIYEYD
jgi:hypothetical protein